MATLSSRSIHKVSARKALETVKEGRCYNIMCIVTEGSSEDIEGLVAALADHPNAFEGLYIDHCPVSDKAGESLGRYLASSKSINELHMVSTGLTEKSYLAIAKALHTNVSLETIIIKENLESSATIDAAFVDALREGPSRSQYSFWSLYCNIVQDYERLLDQV